MSKLPDPHHSLSTTAVPEPATGILLAVGVLRTRVGYAGGTTKNPTYRSIGDHSETIQIDYDPAQITYEKLLDVFWESHNPEHSGSSQQYRSTIFFHNEQQRQSAMASKQQWETNLGKILFTDIEPLQDFTWAEDYHQKYDLRRRKELLQEYQEIYPELENFVNSIAVTRVNGYVAGHGSFEQLQEELDLLGLSEKAQERLSERVKR